MANWLNILMMKVTGKISYTPESFLAGGYHTVKVQVKDGFENPAELTWSFFITAGSQVFHRRT